MSGSYLTIQFGVVDNRFHCRGFASFAGNCIVPAKMRTTYCALVALSGLSECLKVFESPPSMTGIPLQATHAIWVRGSTRKVELQRPDGEKVTTHSNSVISGRPSSAFTFGYWPQSASNGGDPAQFTLGGGWLPLMLSQPWVGAPGVRHASRNAVTNSISLSELGGFTK
jgi:hypothetical protein